MNNKARLAGGIALLALSVSAQEVRVFAGSAGGAAPQTFEFISAGMAMEGKVVKGAPYSADASSESVQTLADGNRVVHKNSSRQYRDSEGRTRREQSLEAIGPWAASGEPRQMIFISDPVAGVNYVLEPSTKTARKIPVMKWTGSGGEVTVEAQVLAHGTPLAEAPSASTANVIITRSFERTGMDRSASDVKKESLGKRSFEGVEADGNRSTVTIPAGRIGNERAMEIVSETWYAPDLQITVFSESRDPRMGTTTFRLTGIGRGEQPHSLFEVPSDYTLKEESARPMRMKKNDM